MELAVIIVHNVTQVIHTLILLPWYPIRLQVNQILQCQIKHIHNFLLEIQFSTTHFENMSHSLAVSKSLHSTTLKLN